MTTADPAGVPRPGDAPWDLAFLRVGLLVTLPLTAVAAVLVGALSSWGDGLSVLLGAAVVTGFFAVSGLVVTWAGRVQDSYTLPAALGTFLVKMLVLVAVLKALPEDGWVDRRVLGWTVVAGALLWSVVQARWVWAKPLYYVTPPAPPAPAADGRSAPAQPPVVDPETRTTRG
jgi:asparagine N-glycosylation enzyme membrane subunit Stt3